MFAELAILAFTGAPPGPETDGSALARAEREGRRSERVREQWLLSLEAVTRVPVDLGAQVGVETPFGLRLFAGYAWVPDAYIGSITGIAANATNDSRARILLDSVDYSGRTLRVTLGIRPFSRLGFYFDAGYAHVRLRAARDLPDLFIPGVIALRGGYEAASSLDLWVAELGYQVQLARRLVLAAGFGIAGTLDARTRILPVRGAPDDPAIHEGARQVDRAFVDYGYVPTLTLRVGFDLI